jgi:hypothetical protein
VGDEAARAFCGEVSVEEAIQTATSRTPGFFLK